METTEYLRPSMLPKLARCGLYRPDVAGAAADRGTKLDVAFRALIQGNSAPLGELLADEIDAVKWAAGTARALAGSHALEAEESALRIECEGMTGTADLLCESAGWSADLKSGQKRGYVEQQAAYALGFMDRTFTDEWTVYLIYCDLREVATLRFTREEAESYVRSTLAKAKAPQGPELNDYCGWCASRWTCAARRESVGLWPVDGPEAVNIETLSGEQLRDFALRAKVIEDFTEKARELLLAKLIAGEKVPGCSIASRKGAEKAPVKLIEANIRLLGFGDILNAYGPMSAAKLREIWERKCGDIPFPESEIEQLPGSSFVRVGRPKGGEDGAK